MLHNSNNVSIEHLIFAGLWLRTFCVLTNAFFSALKSGTARPVLNINPGAPEVIPLRKPQN